MDFLLVIFYIIVEIEVNSAESLENISHGGTEVTERHGGYGGTE